MERSEQPVDAGVLFGQLETVRGECESHGPWSREAPAMFARRIGCPLCSDDARQAREAAELEQRRQAAERRRAEALAERGVGARHLGKTFESFVAETPEQAKALEACRALADAVVSGKPMVPSLILSGAPGTGKTHLTCAIVQRCFDAGRNALKANVMQIVRDIKSSWRRDADLDEDGVLNLYSSPDVLVIDEIGVQFGSDTERLYVFEIINRRYERCLPTVLITNLDIAGLRQEIGERVLDRVREGGGRCLVFTGKSWRVQ